jgi:16S rRNA A1518/A1519 N6-dimethyltransferase RsmA/KsgA/DIM1 with predicted DNA glycosylase/AP lyase activity
VFILNKNLNKYLELDMVGPAIISVEIRTLRQEDLKLETSLGYILRTCLIKKRKTLKKKFNEIFNVTEYFCNQHSIKMNQNYAN